MTTPSPLVEQLQQRLGDAQDHLEYVAEQYNKATAPPDVQQEADPQTDPRNQKEYTFSFRYKAPHSKKVYAGRFTNRVLSIAQRQMVGMLRARYAGGTPFVELDIFTVELNAMLAHLEVSLTDRPDWAKKLTELHDWKLLQALWAEVALHEATFCGWGDDESQSPAQDSNKG